MPEASSPAQPAVECCGVVCDDVRLMEIEHGRIAVSISRQDVKRITLREGVLVPHPILQVLVGLGLSALSYYPVRHLMEWLQHGGGLFRPELLVIGVSVMGLWLVVTAFRRGRYLEVETTQGTKRLAFQKRPDPDALNAFIGSIEQRYNARVEGR